MSTMEQALREMLEEALACMEGLAHDVSGCEHLNDDYFKDSICTRIRARLAALTAALPAPGVEAPGNYGAGFRAGIEAAAKVSDAWANDAILEARSTLRFLAASIRLLALTPEPPR